MSVQHKTYRSIQVSMEKPFNKTIRQQLVLPQAEDIEVEDITSSRYSYTSQAHVPLTHSYICSTTAEAWISILPLCLLHFMVVPNLKCLLQTILTNSISMNHLHQTIIIQVKRNEIIRNTKWDTNNVLEPVFADFVLSLPK